MGILLLHLTHISERHALMAYGDRALNTPPSPRATGINEYALTVAVMTCQARGGATERDISTASRARKYLGCQAKI